MSELTATGYIDYARKRLVWFEDFQLAGEYLTAELADFCDQLLLRSDSSHDTFVAFVPADNLGTDDFTHVRDAFRVFGRTYHTSPMRTHIIIAVFVASSPNSHVISAIQQLKQGPDAEVRQTFLGWTVSLREQAVVPHSGPPPEKSILRWLQDFSEPDMSGLSEAESRPPYRIPRRSPQLSSQGSRRRAPWRTRGNPWVTHLLLAVIAGVFVLEYLQGGSTRIEVLLQLGARNNMLVSQGQWWRLFTYQFLHIGLLHIGLNGLSLWWLGPGVEYAYGHWNFLLIYLGSGTLGGIAGYLFGGPLSRTVSAGASGAIFGLFGAYAYFALMQTRWARQLALRQIGLIVVLNILFGISQPGIDNLAHLGGLTGGFLLSVVFAPSGRTAFVHRVLAAAAIIVIFFIGGGMQLVTVILHG